MGVCSSAEQVAAAFEPRPAAATKSAAVDEKDVQPTDVVPLLPSFDDGGWADPRAWELEHVKALTDAWKETMEFKFALSREDLGVWFAAVPQLRDRDLDEFLDRVFAAFDRDSDTCDYRCRCRARAPASAPRPRPH